MKTATKENIHVRSFREFISQRLPEALAAVIPLSDYQAEWTGDGKGRVEFSVGSNGPRLIFDDLPFPYSDGSFAPYGSERVVVLVASSSNLEEAEIKAVGEQLYDEIAPRLSTPPPDVAWDEALLRAWFPLDRWLREFHSRQTSHYLFYYSPISRMSQLRQIYIDAKTVGFHPSQIGRACPYETSNSERLLSLAVGAEVRDGKIIPATDKEGALGFTASLIPLLCHNDSRRQIIALGTMREWLPIDEPEPPLVRSGNEPEDGSTYLGRNFLTAFAHWKGMNYEDALVISESAAKRLSSPEPLRIGDKLSNRHGAKGVIGAILPDDEMPHLPDGRAVDLIFDAMGVYSRLNFGQILEASLGLIAEKTGKPFIAPPFMKTTPQEMHALLKNAGLPESGQFKLRDGKNGAELDEPTTVGVVYWGKSFHRAAEKIHATPWSGKEKYLGQRSGRLEYFALRTAGAKENILDVFSTRALRPGPAAPGGGSTILLSDEEKNVPTQEEIDALLESVANGFLPAAALPPSPAFKRVQRALRTIMIDLSLKDNQVKVSWAKPGKDDIALAEPMEHPWRPGAMLTHLGPSRGYIETYQRVIAANEALAQALRAGAHSAIQGAARASLRQALDELFEKLASACTVEFFVNAHFSGRSVLVPGYDLKLGEVGLPEEIAWSFFGPLIAGKVGKDKVLARSKEALRAIESLMKQSVVNVNRAPTTEPTSIIAFTPRMWNGKSIQLHPLCCALFNADYDGDQAAVWLPLSEPAQKEAKEKLTLVGHLKRDPSVIIGHMTPRQSILMGLAYALESKEGRAEFDTLWPSDCEQPNRPLTSAGLLPRLIKVYEKRGAEKLLNLLERLYEMGLRWATKSGASYSPFVGEGLELPPLPASDAGWYIYGSLLDNAILEQGESNPNLRDPVRAIRCGARGSAAQLRATIGPWGVAKPNDPDGVFRHGFRDGFESAELWRWTARARQAMQGVQDELNEWAISTTRFSADGSVLRRALASQNAAQIFAEAADKNETDPLTDADVRLWMGLPIEPDQ